MDSGNSAGRHPRPDAESDLTGRVYSSELLGDSTLLNIRSGDGLIVVKANSDSGRRMGEEISLAFEPSKVAVFDGRSGERAAS